MRTIFRYESRDENQVKNILAHYHDIEKKVKFLKGQIKKCKDDFAKKSKHIGSVKVVSFCAQYVKANRWWN